MFRYVSLRSLEVLNGLGDRGPDPRFCGEVFDYIRSEITYDVLWPPLPDSDQWYLIVEKMTAKLNEIHERTLTLDEHITNHIIRYRRGYGKLIPPDQPPSNGGSDNLSKLDLQDMT